MNEYARLNRVTYGPTPASIRELKEMGWEKWVTRQLNPGEDDPEFTRRLKDFSFRLEVEIKGKEKEKQFGISHYFKSAKELLELARDIDEDDEYLLRLPAIETVLITWLRNYYSQWQLREIMVEFWHNHFNVSIEAHDAIPLFLPIYDREVIRKHVFGNFRALLEDTAKSPCMLLYLDNAFSKSGPANENYARELFELHTLGAENYFNHLYDEWRQVPGAWEGKAEGYIDEDVYEAARAFTGWTIGAGEEFDGNPEFPNTGEFHYYDGWHDHYQKRIMGVEFKSHQGPMADGLRVLDLVAYHPGTAHFLCKKICRWLVDDKPPESLVKSAAALWMEHQKSPDQIGRVIAHILLSPEFEAGLGSKIKRPNVLLSSLVRSLDMDALPTPELFWWLEQMGFHQFSWATPTGHPDQSAYWLNTDMLLKRWNTLPIMLVVEPDDGGILQLSFADQSPEEQDNAAKLIAYWSQRILGQAPPPDIQQQLEAIFMGDMEGATIPYVREHHPEGFEFKLRQMASLLAMSPDFQRR